MRDGGWTVTEMQRPIPDLLILGDIHGFPGGDDLSISDWHRPRVISLVEICGRPDLSGERLHDHLFKGDGLERAVHTVCQIGGSPGIGIGFSAGGTVLWNAVKQGLGLDALVCVSSTRLRLETSPLAIPTLTLWGELDPHRPAESWNAIIPAFSKTYPDQSHDFYKAQLSRPCSPLWSDIAAFLGDGLISS